MPVHRSRLNEYQFQVVNNLKGNDYSQSFQRWVVLPCIHRPFHNKQLWDKTMQMITDMNGSLYGIILAGDYLDLFTLASFNKGSVELLRDITLADEYRSGREGLDDIERAAPDGVKKYYIYGNHEDRYFREKDKADTGKYGDMLIPPTEGLRLRERGWQVRDNWQDDYVTLGEHLDVMHGVYTNKYAAEKHLRMHGGSCMFGHTHEQQVYRKGEQAAYNIGCMIDLDHKVFTYASRMKRKKWANGFALVNIMDSGDFYVQMVNVYDDQFFANGKLY